MAGEVVARARALVGVPFRLHGRDARGIDCVGLVAAAHSVSDVPSGYALRTNDPDAVAVPIRSIGFRKRHAPARAGDVMLMQAGPAQLHLGLCTGASLIHADAGLRRVVETPGEPRWPILSIWGR